jgi:hypothetical protein
LPPQIKENAMIRFAWKAALAAAIATLSLTVMSSASAQFGTPGSSASDAGTPGLIDNTYLRSGQMIVSPSGGYVAQLQRDANLCVRPIGAPGAATARQPNTWCLRKQSQPDGDYHLLMQRDGNLCIYTGAAPSPTAAGVVCTSSQRSSGAMYQLTLGDDGNLLIDSRNADGTRGARIWSAKEGNASMGHVGGQYTTAHRDVFYASDCIGLFYAQLTEMEAEFRRHAQPAILARGLSEIAEKRGRLRRWEGPYSQLERSSQLVKCDYWGPSVDELHNWLRREIGQAPPVQAPIGPGGRNPNNY